jgi:hypothetical protein
MFARLAELGPRKILILVILTMSAMRLGWSAVSPYMNTAQSDTEKCQALAEGIRLKLTEANHCDTNDDCMEMALACPFSCNTYTHFTTPLAPIKEKIREYNEQCGFCVEECTHAKPVCVNHQCLSFATLPTGEKNAH